MSFYKEGCLRWFVGKNENDFVSLYFWFSTAWKSKNTVFSESGFVGSRRDVRKLTVITVNNTDVNRDFSRVMSN